MANLQQIREALAKTIRSHTKIAMSVYPYVQDIGEPPAVLIEPEKLDTEGAFGRGMYRWNLRLYVLVPRGVSGEHGQFKLDKLLDQDGDGIPKIIFDHPDLGLTDGTDAQVVSMFGYGGESVWTKVPHVGAILRVEVITDPRA